jgi:hypothetical protein
LLLYGQITSQALRAVIARVDGTALRELMEHSIIATTMRYVQPIPEHERKAMEKLEQFNIGQVSVWAPKCRVSTKFLIVVLADDFLVLLDY